MNVHARTMEMVAGAYGVVYGKITDAFNKYEGLQPKTVEQVCKIFLVGFSLNLSRRKLARR